MAQFKKAKEAQEPGSWWKPSRRRAAALLAAGWNKRDAAREVNIKERTIWRWMENVEFAAEIQRLTDQMLDGVITEGLADRRRRVERIMKRLGQIEELIQARAEVPVKDDDKAGWSSLPGATTGLLAIERTSKRETKVGRFDAALLREEREYLRQLAIELGQWEERTEVSFTKALVGVDLDEV